MRKAKKISGLSSLGWACVFWVIPFARAHGAPPFAEGAGTIAAHRACAYYFEEISRSAEEKGFRESNARQPWNALPRLVMADWYDEKSFTKVAELLRLQSRDIPEAQSAAERQTLQKRVNELLRDPEVQQALLQGIAPLAGGQGFRPLSSDADPPFLRGDAFQIEGGRLTGIRINALRARLGVVRTGAPDNRQDRVGIPQGPAGPAVETIGGLPEVLDSGRPVRFVSLLLLHNPELRRIEYAAFNRNAEVLNTVLRGIRETLDGEHGQGMPLSEIGSEKLMGAPAETTAGGGIRARIRFTQDEDNLRVDSAGVGPVTIGLYDGEGKLKATMFLDGTAEAANAVFENVDRSDRIRLVGYPVYSILPSGLDQIFSQPGPTTQPPLQPLPVPRGASIIHRAP